LLIALIVVSMPATTYAARSGAHDSLPISPRSAASKTARPMLPGARSVASRLSSHPNISPDSGSDSAVRAFDGPKLVNVASAQGSSRSTTASGTPMRPATTETAKARARSSTASKVRPATSEPTSSSARSSMSAFSPRSAFGASRAASTPRSWAWTGGSAARTVPRSRAFFSALSATPSWEEKVSQSCRALRISS
jgi:hypothetical protein